MAQNLRHSTILLSHLHWDHIAGLPFFTPIYVPGHHVEIASGPNGVMPLGQAMREVFRAPFFPVGYDDLGGTVTTREGPKANDTFVIGDITITMAKLNHPDPVYGFRLDMHPGPVRSCMRPDTGALLRRRSDAAEAHVGRRHPDLRLAVHA